jgi:hypothetical protein
LQLSHSLKNVVARDFPEHWPELLTNVKQMLGSGNIREVASGCVAALEIVRAFRYVISHIHLTSRLNSDLFTNSIGQLPSR